MPDDVWQDKRGKTSRTRLCGSWDLKETGEDTFYRLIEHRVVFLTHRLTPRAEIWLPERSSHMFGLSSSTPRVRGA